MEARWLPGVWLGKRWTTDEHIVALPGGTVARAREVRPMPDDQAFDSEIVKAIVGLPSDPSGSGEPVRAPRDVPRVPVPREAAPVREATVRRVIIKRAYLERFGYTDGCRKCRDIQRGEESLGTVGHSEECRKRIEEEMTKDPELKKRLEAAEERQTKYMAEKVQEGDSRNAPAVEPSVPAAEEKEAEVDAAQVPVGDDSDQDLPEAGEEEEPEAKRARLRTASEGGASAAESENFDEQPENKRPRTDLHTMEQSKIGSWADWTSDEEREEGVEHECQSSVLPPDELTCGHCGSRFASKNKLFKHLRSLGLEAKGRAVTFEATEAELQSLDRTAAKRGSQRRRAQVRRVSKYDVCEMFSPPRMASMAAKMGLRGGWSLDVAASCPKTQRVWNLLQDAREAKRLLQQDAPGLLIMSPPCTLFSSFQNLCTNGLPEARCPKQWQEAIEMVICSVEMARVQMRQGGKFVFEQFSNGLDLGKDGAEEVA